jgi:hypothetical protein
MHHMVKSLYMTTSILECYIFMVLIFDVRIGEVLGATSNSPYSIS